MAKSKIEWCDVVWNPVTGCDKVSEGCRNCYAERHAKRFWGDRKFTDVQCHIDRLDQPVYWKKPQRIFVNSMSDLFHPDVDFDFILCAWMVMAQAKQHTFIILTKRPEHMNLFLNEWLPPALGLATCTLRILDKPLPNVWLGVSVEDQKTANERIPLLLQTPATVRFVSYEPALGPVDFTHIKIKDSEHPELGEPPVTFNALDGWWGGYIQEKRTQLDWIIMGGESGPGARPMHPNWTRSVRDQCQAAGVPFFFKQWGEWEQAWPSMGLHVKKRTFVFSDGLAMYMTGKKNAGRLLDGVEWNGMPE